ncbi:MAG: hypothetical protein NWR50_06535 [Crocinitomicaceae bacterium]|nr:hypothetical protein [Crocinitomicaceae bacterium]
MEELNFPIGTLAFFRSTCSTSGVCRTSGAVGFGVAGSLSRKC